MTSPLVHAVSEWISAAHLEHLFGNGGDRSSSAEAATSSRHGDDEDEGSDDDADDIDELLYASQMYFVAHDATSAVGKLQQAVGLRSSAACATLGNFLSRSLRSGKPAQSPPLHPVGAHHRHHPSPIQHDGDAMAAARLFVLGLDYELAKPLESEARPKARQSRGTSSSGWTSADSSDTESESAEGRYMNLERVLDLVVGLTDCYRYGVLQPTQELNLPPLQRLWKRGGLMAERALQLPFINDAPLPTPSIDPTPQSTSPDSLATPPISIAIPETPLSEEIPGRSPSSSRRTPIARSYTHPAHHFSSPLNYVPSSTPTTNVSHHLSAHMKHRLTIQIHLFYLLALQKWPSDKHLAEKYWNEILRVAASTGGLVGTKEGNEIVSKATRRLHALRPEGDQDWKLVKKRKGRNGSVRSNSTDTHHVMIAPIPNLEMNRDEGFLARRSRVRSGDALKEMLWEQKEAANYSEEDGVPATLKGKGKEREVEGDGDVASSAITIVPNRRSGGAEPSDSSVSDTIRASITPRTSATSITPSPRPSKFHFAGTVDYPSPPDTPSSSPPPSEDLTSSQSKEPATKRIRRVTSTSSFRPPRLLPRVQSSASVSTLPPDFFSARSRVISGASWTGTTRATTDSSIDFARGLGPDDRSASGPLSGVAGNGWTGTLRNRLATLRVGSTRVASSLNPFRIPTLKLSAVTTLKHVLERDDKAAGPGMYWAFEDDEDHLETDHEDEGDEEHHPRPHPPVGPSPLKPRPRQVEELSPSTPVRPKAQARRSFVDPTSHNNGTPGLVLQPPTPVKSGSGASTDPNPTPAPVSIDPLLLELERKSRVGVRTKCATCGKKGLNFPACPRCKKTYCSRVCRTSVDGAGDGARHICVEE